MTSADIITIKLLDREYQIKCQPGKNAELQEAANYLSAKMRENQEEGKFINPDKVFMITALNIVNELISLKKQKTCYLDTMNQRISSLQKKIDQALSE